MHSQIVRHQEKSIQCVRYSLDDEPSILDIFFFWKTSVLLAEQSKSKKPQLPETFSEPFCCLGCDLVHKRGAGVDAFRVDSAGHVTEAIEIKATGSGLQLVADLLTNCLISPAPALSRDQKSSIHGRCSN